ncbi:AfsR/SARP family transcriptional regulator [Sphingomonas sp.]
MKRWRLTMLGSTIAAPVAGEPATLPAGAWPLFGYLVARRRHDAPRDAVVSALWPDQTIEAARHNLATLMWRIRSAFGDAAGPLEAHGGRLALRPQSGLWIDALALEHRARAALKGVPVGTRARTRRDLVALAGDFLPSVDAEWALLERERLRCLRLDGLFALASADACDGDWQAVIETGRALCAAEPLREDAQRLLMLGYARTGNRALAIRQYARCAAILADELGIDPMPETQALHRQLAGGSPGVGDVPPPVPVEAPELRTALVAARDTMTTAIGLIDNAIMPL